MTTWTSILALFALTAVLACAGEKHPPAAPSARHPIAVASPAPSASASGGTEARVPITAADARKLFTDFQNALRKELKTNEQTNAQEYRDFKANQAKELKRWKEEENKATKQFFATHASSSERRVYMHDRRHRYDDFIKAQAQARTDLLHLQEERTRGLKSQQLVRVREFQEYLTRNEKPPTWLWGESAAGG